MGVKTKLKKNKYYKKKKTQQNPTATRKKDEIDKLWLKKCTKSFRRDIQDK